MSADTSVFLSYSHQDGRSVQRLSGQLRAAGIGVFLDTQRIGSGDDFELTIYRALREDATHLVVVVTPSSLDSAWVLYESLIAERAGLPTIPFFQVGSLDMTGHFLADCEPPVSGIEELLAALGSERVSPRRSAPRWNLTTYPTPHFVGREAELQQITSRIGHEAPCVVVGLGGVGKSQLALQHAIRNATRYGTIWWVRGQDKATLTEDLANLAVALGLAPPLGPQHVALEAVHGWLRMESDWLLVVDDLADRTLLAECGLESPSGHLLITSRNADWGDWATTDLLPLTESEAVTFVSRRTQERVSNDMQALVTRLGCLPLALAQAAAFIRQERLSCSEYLDLVAEQSEVAWEKGELVETSERVSSTWRITLSSLSSADPSAKEALQTLSFLAPDGIPIDLLRGAPWSATRPWNLLRKYSMIRQQDDRVSLHPVLQEVTRAFLPDDEPYISLAISMLRAALPGYTEDAAAWQRARPLLVHVRAASAFAEEAFLSSIDLATTLNDAGLFEYYLGDYESAEALHQSALDCAMSLNGAGSPSLAPLLNNLGRDKRALGFAQVAADLFQRAIELGGDQVDAIDQATWTNNLAGAYEDLNRFDEAIAMYRDVLVVRRETLGPTHVLAGEALNNLGLAYYNAGHGTTEGAGLLREAIEVRRLALGPDHPFVAESLDNLGLLLARQGALDQSECAHREALETFLRQREEDHPSVTRCRLNLAACLEKQGRHQEADAVVSNADWRDLVGRDSSFERALPVHKN